MRSRLSKTDRDGLYFIYFIGTSVKEFRFISEVLAMVFGLTDSVYGPGLDRFTVPIFTVSNLYHLPVSLTLVVISSLPTVTIYSLPADSASAA